MLNLRQILALMVIRARQFLNIEVLYHVVVGNRSHASLCELEYFFL